jgi:hypothetical protein
VRVDRGEPERPDQPYSFSGYPLHFIFKRVSGGIFDENFERQNGYGKGIGINGISSPR